MTLIDRAVRATRTRRPRLTDAAAVFGLALLVRLALIVTSPGGFTGNYGYDAGVYYASADALIHGRLPYADYLLLHPPGLTLVLTPFAALGRLTSDHTGFITGNIAFSALGAGSAALIVLIARRLGLGRCAALVGGSFYAVWLSAAGPEISARLEPLGTFAFLCGVLLLSGSTSSNRRWVYAGVALGFAITTKIWWVVPVAVLIAWQAFAERDRRGATRVLAGAGATLVVVLGPFFAAAPRQMWRMIVSDQLARHASRASPFRRVFKLSSLNQFGGGLTMRVAGTLLVAIVAVALGVAAWRQRSARPIVVVAAAQIGVLLAAPTYFGYYSGFLAGSVALVVAAAAQPRPSRLAFLRSAALGIVPVAALVVATAVTATALVTARPVVATTKPLAVGSLPSAVSNVRCVTADSPMALIALNSLSRGLANGCENWVDVSGRTYDVDAPSGRHVARSKNRRWQADISRYLRSGQAVIVIRSATGLSRSTLRGIRSLPVLARSGTLTVYEVGGQSTR